MNGSLREVNNHQYGWYLWGQNPPLRRNKVRVGTGVHRYRYEERTVTFTFSWGRQEDHFLKGEEGVTVGEVLPSCHSQWLSFFLAVTPSQEPPQPPFSSTHFPKSWICFSDSGLVSNNITSPCTEWLTQGQIWTSMGKNGDFARKFSRWT